MRRVQTILAAADGASTDAIARGLRLCCDTVRNWRQGWREGAEASMRLKRPPMEVMSRNVCVDDWHLQASKTD